MNFKMENVLLLSLCFLLFTCQASPRYDCYYWFIVSGSIKDGGNNSLDGVEVRTSYYPENPTPKLTDVNGNFSLTFQSYYKYETLNLIFSKAGFQSQNSAVISATDIENGCNAKVSFVRDAVLVP